MPHAVAHVCLHDGAGAHQEGTGQEVEADRGVQDLDSLPWRKAAQASMPHAALVAVDDLGALEHEGRAREEHGIAGEQTVPHAGHQLRQQQGSEGRLFALRRQPHIHICTQHTPSGHSCRPVRFCCPPAAHIGAAC